MLFAIITAPVFSPKSNLQSTLSDHLYFGHAVVPIICRFSTNRPSALHTFLNSLFYMPCLNSNYLQHCAHRQGSTPHLESCPSECPSSKHLDLSTAFSNFEFRTVMRSFHVHFLQEYIAGYLHWYLPSKPFCYDPVSHTPSANISLLIQLYMRLLFRRYLDYSQLPRTKELQFH